MTPDLVWYVAYGSNLSAARFACYLAGGTPPGAMRIYPGCRDRRPARGSIPVTLPGTLYFAGESSVWTGGMALYDHDEPGPTYGRGYLITAKQFADVATQEMHRIPGEHLDLTDVLATGRHRFGPGRYETLVLVGEHDGHPMLTFTAPGRAIDVPHTTPAAAYIRMIAAGLAEMHSLTDDEIAAYLAIAPSQPSVRPDRESQSGA
jgi:hypothetical protein